MITINWVTSNTQAYYEGTAVTVKDGVASLQVDVDDTASYRYREVMQQRRLYLVFQLPYWVDIPLGAYADYQGERYVLHQEAQLEKQAPRNIKYTLTMGGDEDALTLYKLRNVEDGRLKFSMCARPAEFARQIVENLNQRGTSATWAVGDCLDTTEQTIEFNHVYLLDALETIADQFGTEWEVVDHKVCIHKVEYYKDAPLPLSYGKGNGFEPGVGRETDTSNTPIKRMYIEGSDRNIDASTYGNSTLLLPKSKTLQYEGRTYKSDAQGYYLERTDKVSTAQKEDSLDCTDVYPSRIGTVTSVETGSEAAAVKNHLYDILDKNIPDALDYSTLVISGETATIEFQTGMLAGREFEWTYKHAERRFKLVPQEYDGITMPDPDTGYMPAVGDQYAVFGISMPQQYIADDETQTGAEWDMMRLAAKALYEAEEQQFTFSGTVQGLWAKQNWETLGGYLKVGSYIKFTDKQFLPDGTSIRITAVKDYVNRPFEPEVEISTSVSGGTVGSQLRKVDQEEVRASEQVKEVLQFARRRFRAVTETTEALQKAVEGFTDGVRPITLQTMQAVVGTDVLQFDFVKSTTELTVITPPFTWDTVHGILTLPQTAIMHYSLGITALSAAHTDAERLKWAVTAWESPYLGGDLSSNVYYVYLKCPNTSFDANNISTINATVYLTTAVTDRDAETGYYYLLCGILSSDTGTNERSLALFNGYTEITPGQITTDRLVSTDGQSYFNMQGGGSMALGDKLFYSNGNLYIKGDIEATSGTFTGTINATSGTLGGWKIDNDAIVTKQTTTIGSTEYNNARLEADGDIYLYSEVGDEGNGARLSMEAIDGRIMAKSMTSNGETTLLPQGVQAFADRGIVYDSLNTAGVFTCQGLTAETSETVAGIYGHATHKKGGAAYGGYFDNLFANGRCFKFASITTTGQTLPSNATLVVITQNATLNASLYQEGQAILIYNGDFSNYHDLTLSGSQVGTLWGTEKVSSTCVRLLRGSAHLFVLHGSLWYAVRLFAV